jgi:hypothetical protein
LVNEVRTVGGGGEHRGARALAHWLRRSVERDYGFREGHLLFGRGLYEVMEEFWTAPERADGHEVEAAVHAVRTLRARRPPASFLGGPDGRCSHGRRVPELSPQRRMIMLIMGW